MVKNKKKTLTHRLSSWLIADIVFVVVFVMKGEPMHIEQGLHLLLFRGVFGTLSNI